MANGELSLRDELSAGFSKAADPAPVEPDNSGLDDAGMPKLSPGDLPLPNGGPRAPELQKQRDATGRFVPAGQRAAPEPAPAATQTAPEPVQDTPVPAAKTYAPPVGWTATAKAEFDKLPQPVKEAVAKREEEINNGFKKLQDYKGLDTYVESAHRAGTTLPEALDRYMQAEALLERDPIQGLLWLCQSYNVDPRQLMGGQMQPGAQAQPNQGWPAGQPQGQNPYEMQRYMQPVVQDVAQLKQMLAQERQNKIAGDINAFASDPKNRYFENVADQMAMIIQAGSTAPLAEVYEQACYMNPEVRGLLIREQTAKAQADQVAKAKQIAQSARQAGNSVTGGTGSPQPTTPPNLSLRDEISGLYYGNRA